MFYSLGAYSCHVHGEGGHRKQGRTERPVETRVTARDAASYTSTNAWPRGRIASRSALGSHYACMLRGHVPVPRCDSGAEL